MHPINVEIGPLLVPGGLLVAGLLMWLVDSIQDRKEGRSMRK